MPMQLTKAIDDMPDEPERFDTCPYCGHWLGQNDMRDNGEAHIACRRLNDLGLLPIKRKQT